MFSTKKHLSRRTFLRGTGVAVGLPFLDAMVPAWTVLAQTAASPKPRMGFMYLPHGAIMEHWTPEATGANFELPAILKPLAPFQKQLTIVSGLENKPTIAPPVHALNPGTWLSCVTPRATVDPYGGVTIDQIAAAHIGQDTPLPSLEVATEGRGGGGACDRIYGCSYGNTISFRTPTTPLPMEADPRKLFERLFGQGDTAQERKAITRQYIEHPRPGHAGGVRTASDARRARPGQAGRLSRKRARDRAPRAEDGDAGSVGPRPAGRAGVHQRSTSA